MFRIFFTSGVILVLATSCIRSLFCINGNGKVVTEVRNTITYDEAVNTTAVDLVYHKADTFGISVIAESNLIPHIITSVNDGRLEVKTDPRNACFDYTHKPVVIITSPVLHIMELTGSGDFTSDELTGNAVGVKLTGSGDLKASAISGIDLTVTLTGSGDADIDNATFQNADLTVTGSGDINIKGNGSNGTMRVTGSGDIKARDCTIMNAVETITGSGDIFTRVVTSLIAVISGSGNIHLSGNPSLNQTITGSGRIIRD